MSYSIRLVSRIERENRIRNTTAAATVAEERDFYEFRGEKRRLKIVRLDIGLPVYRIENCRTFTQQEEHIAKTGKPVDFFLHGQESESVQHIQHQLLAALAASGTESIVPILEVLKKEGQREEILITISGVVVNGNRRLAGMRELFAMAPGDFESFSHVNCMVLPEDATSAEILDVEASLQAKQETKLDYDWIGDCRLITRLLENNGTIPLVAKKLHRKEKEIENSLKAFSEAQLYLREWAGKPKEFSLVKDDGEQFFNDLPKSLNGKPQKIEEASRAIAWILFDSRRKLEGRIYNFNIALGRRATDVLDRVAKELNVPNTSDAVTTDKSGFAVDLEGVQTEPTYDNLLKVLRNPERREEVSETVIEVCQGVVLSEQDRNSGLNAQKAVIAAAARLMEIDLSTAAPSTYTVIGRQLKAISDRASLLSSQLVKYQAHRTSKASPRESTT
jgi:hypothetical protein